MAKITVKYHKLGLSESVALLKDSQTKERNWRHRFIVSKKSNTIGTQVFKDYPHKKFKTFKEFEAYIIEQNEKTKKPFDIDG